MSVLLALATPVVQAVATATPVVTATPAPAAAVAADPGFLAYVNSLVAGVSQANIVAFASVLALALQGAFNRLPFFKHVVEYVQDVRRFVLAVFLPTVLTVGAGLATGENELKLAPIVFLFAQVGFYVVKFLVGRALATFAAPVEPTTAGYVSTTGTTGTVVTAADPGQQF